MKWIANPPVTSKIPTRVNASSYGTDMKMDFIAGDLSLENGDIATVSGVDCFKQHVVTSVLTEPVNQITRYGLSHNIANVDTQEEFEREALSLAEKMVEQVLEDGVTKEPQGLGFTIDSILSMALTKKGSVKYLDIEMTVAGLSNPIVVTVPRVNDR